MLLHNIPVRYVTWKALGLLDIPFCRVFDPGRLRKNTGSDLMKKPILFLSQYLIIWRKKGQIFYNHTLLYLTIGQQILKISSGLIDFKEFSNLGVSEHFKNRIRLLGSETLRGRKRVQQDGFPVQPPKKHSKKTLEVELWFFYFLLEILYCN